MGVKQAGLYTWDGITGNELWQIHRLIWAVVASFWLLTFFVWIIHNSMIFIQRSVFIYVYLHIHIGIVSYITVSCGMGHCLVALSAICCHCDLFFVGDSGQNLYNGPTADVPSQIILPKTNSKSSENGPFVPKRKLHSNHFFLGAMLIWSNKSQVNPINHQGNPSFQVQTWC